MNILTNILKSAVVLRNNRNYSIRFMPQIIEQTSVGERSYGIFSRLLRDRIICLMSPINDEVASLIIAQLLYLHSENAKSPIHMYINSPGGAVQAGMAIYDTMQHIQSPISTWCIGQACSMASFILCAGSHGSRYSLPNSKIMVHQPSGSAEGQVTDILIRAELLISIKKNMYQLYTKHTKQPFEVIENLMERDHYMTPQEALNFGLIDRVVMPPHSKNVKPESIPTQLSEK